MKTILASLNSKYIHSSLAPWYLKQACGNRNVKVMEFTVNRDLRGTLHDLFEEKPDLIGFSCYIFNIVQIETLVNALKKLKPDLQIVLGGPEVSYDAPGVLARCGADYVVCGEGEQAFSALVAALSEGERADNIPGVCTRDNIKSFALAPKPKGAPASPYTEQMLKASGGRILYFESSRGCPFKCAYCLSPACGGVRFFPLNEVFPELEKVMASTARQVKFVDRTFNANAQRASEILRFILNAAKRDPECTGKKNYHFEAAADLFDDTLLELLRSAPPGLFQLEIGIQSLNAETLAAVGRKTDLALCRRNIQRLLEKNNIHLHLDLIAGLPCEDYNSFEQSFNGVFEMQPHTIQLGILKLLKGSELRARAESLGIVYDPAPPYAVLGTPLLSFDELGRLERIAECVERLYNSGRFHTSLRFLTGKFSSPFALFETFENELKTGGFFERALSLKELYGIFKNFAEKRLGSRDFFLFGELLKFDYFRTDSACCPPEGFGRIQEPRMREYYRRLPTGVGRRHLERFGIDPTAFPFSGEVSDKPTLLCFDYGRKDPVTGFYGVCPIDPDQLLGQFSEAY